MGVRIRTTSFLLGCSEMTAIASLFRAALEAAAKLLEQPPGFVAGMGDKLVIEVRDENGKLKERRETK